jgi:hypothetical protein
MSIGYKLAEASAKYVFGPMSKGMGKVNKYIEDKTGKSLYDRMNEAEEKDNKLKEEKPILWAAKKIGQGALKGLLGVPFSKD